MISTFLAMKAVVCLRRIAKALESIESMERDRMARDYPPPGCEPPVPKKVTITHHTQEELNQRWLAKQK